MDDTSTLLDLLPAYRRYLESLCHASGTVNGYVHEARSFSEFMLHRNKFLPNTIRATDLSAWQRAMMNSAHIKLTTLVGRMHQLHAFCRFLIDESFTQKDPFIGFPLPHLPSVLPRDVLTLAEVTLLLQTPDNFSVVGRRDHLILELLYATGLRVSELCGLDVKDINLSRRVIHVRCGKGAKDRVVPVGQLTTFKIASYLEEHKPQYAEMPEQSHPLFFNRLGRRMRPAFIEKILRLTAEQCRIKKHVTPHALRHTCATHMHARGAGIFHIKELLGHVEVTTTQIYTRVAPREAQITHRDQHPRERYARRLVRMDLPLPKAAFSQSLPPTPLVKALTSSSSTRSKPVTPAIYGAVPHDSISNDTSRWLGEYKEHLQMLNRGERTIKTHIARLRTFFEFAVTRGVTSYLAVERRLVLDYREHLKSHLIRRKQTTCGAVQNQFVAVVLCFFRFLVYREVLAENPVAGIRYAREPSQLPRGVPSTTDISRIIEQPDLGTMMGLRDRAIMEVLYSSGLRKSELIDLTLNALDLDDGRLNVWGGKGEKDRVVPIGVLATSFVRQYLKLVRPWLAGPATPADILFLSMRGKKLCKNSLLRLVEKYAAAAGLAAFDITPHTFRHAFATHLIQNGANLRHVQDMMGHANISSTQTYVHLAIRDLRRVHKKTHPLG